MICYRMSLRVITDDFNNTEFLTAAGSNLFLFRQELKPTHPKVNTFIVISLN